MWAWIQKHRGTENKNGIYDMPKRKGQSHQRAHNDYLEADPQAQYGFGQVLEEQHQQDARAPDEAIIAVDEFSVHNHPNCYYG